MILRTTGVSSTRVGHTRPTHVRGPRACRRRGAPGPTDVTGRAHGGRVQRPPLPKPCSFLVSVAWPTMSTRVPERHLEQQPSPGVADVQPFQHRRRVGPMTPSPTRTRRDMRRIPAPHPTPRRGGRGRPPASYDPTAAALYARSAAVFTLGTELDHFVVVIPVPIS